MVSQAQVVVEHDLRRGRTDAGAVVYQQAIVAATTSGNTQVVAAVAGRTIRVLWVLVTNAGSAANRVRFQSATTSITAQHDTAPNGGGWFCNTMPAFFCETVAGEALNINLEANGTIDGTVGYALG